MTTPVGGWAAISLRKLERGLPPGIRYHKENPVFALSSLSQSLTAGWKGANHRHRAGSAGVASQPHPQPCLQQSPGPACLDCGSCCPALDLQQLGGHQCGGRKLCMSTNKGRPQPWPPRPPQLSPQIHCFHRKLVSLKTRNL